MTSPILPAVFAACIGLACVPPAAVSAAPQLVTATEASTSQGPDGRMLYLKNCRQCHSASGMPSSETKAKYSKIKALNDSAFLASMSDDSVLTIMKKGAGKDMKPFADRMNNDEMVAVLKYVRTLPSKK